MGQNCYYVTAEVLFSQNWTGTINNIEEIIEQERDATNEAKPVMTMPSLHHAYVWQKPCRKLKIKRLSGSYNKQKNPASYTKYIDLSSNLQ